MAIFRGDVSMSMDPRLGASLRSSMTEPPLKPTDLACPVCGSHNRVVRVSAIQARNIRNNSGGNSALAAQGNLAILPIGSRSRSWISTSKTLLAEMLAPPRAPESDRHYVQGFTILVFCGLIAVTLVGGIGLTLAKARGWWLSDVDKAGSIVRLPEALILSGGLLATAVALLVLRQIWKVRDAAECEREMPQWERAMARWEQLHYCPKDDVVFIPGVGAPVLADDIDELIYA